MANIEVAVDQLLDTAVGHIGFDFVAIAASPEAGPPAHYATVVEKTGPYFAHRGAYPGPAAPAVGTEAAGV